MTQVDQNNGQQTGFNPNNHVMQLKSREGSKDYLPVQWRLIEVCSQSDLFIERSLFAQQALSLSANPYVSKYLSRFLERVEVDDKGCWLWTSTLNNKGYARMGMYKKLVLMHRWSYMLFKGEIEQGLELDHLCKVPNCINPDHLEPVTHRVNNLRGNTIAAKHSKVMSCPQGHPYTEENTLKSKRQTRQCRICKREQAHPYQALIKARITHCPQGHPYDAENTGVGRNGKRYCIACSRVSTPTYYMRSKGHV